MKIEFKNSIIILLEHHHAMVLSMREGNNNPGVANTLKTDATFLL